MPVLECACQEWNPYTQKIIKQLESVGAIDEFVVPILLFIGHHPQVNVILAYSGILSFLLFYLSVTLRTIITARILKNISLPLPDSMHLPSAVNSHHLIFMHIVFFWNCMPYSVVSLSSRNIFKSQLLCT